jgi:hypothetical protein
MQNESKLSKKFSERTTKTVIVLVMTLLFIIPIFQQDMYFHAETSYELGLEIVLKIYDTYGGNSSEYKLAMQEYIKVHVDGKTP